MTTTVTASLGARRASGPESAGRFYRPELDVLRFLAFLAVFLYHEFGESGSSLFRQHHLPPALAHWIAAAFVSGKFGVDLFFALSAYLITELLRREQLVTRTVDLHSFYMRRILRIWPLYFTFLAVSTFLLPRLFPFSHGLTISYLLCFLLLVGNWRCAISGYPGSSAGPLWSVSLEEQFYLLWPLAVRWCGIRSLKHIAVALLLVAFAARAVLVAAHAGYDAIWYGTLSRIDPIACGILLALYLEGQQPHLSIRRALLCALGAVFLLVTVGRLCLASGGASTPAVLLGFPLAALACAALMVASLTIGVDWLGSLRRPLIYLGRISYGLYVFHVFAILAANQAPVSAPVASLLALALTILLASLSYRFLESPFLRLKLRFTHVPSRPGG